MAIHDQSTDLVMGLILLVAEFHFNQLIFKPRMCVQRAPGFQLVSYNHFRPLTCVCP